MSAVKYAEDNIRYESTLSEEGSAAFLGASKICRLAFLAEGGVSCIVGSDTKRYEEGDVFIIDVGVPCELVAEEANTRIYSILFGKTVSDDILDFFDGKGFREELDKNGEICVRLGGIRRNKLEHDISSVGASEFKRNAETLRLTAAKIIYECFIKRSEVPAWVKTPPDWFVEYYMLLSRHYVFTKSFGEIISLAGKSREYVSRLFKSSTGRNISDYIIDLRMNYACNLLKNSSMDVMEISFECGFENLSTFYHHFSKRMGVPPQSYRNTARTK